MIRVITTIALLSALWLGPNRARITWTGPGCLYRNNTLIYCDARSVTHITDLGGPWTDAALRPEAGDVYAVVWPDRPTEKAQLVSRAYFPAFYL